LFCGLACHDTEDTESCKTVCEPCSEIGLELWKSSRYEESESKKSQRFLLGLLAFTGAIYFGRKIGRR
jgi:hypothetical protein